MTVYVHKLGGQGRAFFGTPAGTQVPVAAHYDVTLGERDRAVALGARAITPRESDQMERQRAAGLGYT